MNYYRSTFVLLGAFFVLGIAGFVCACMWTEQQKTEFVAAIASAHQVASDRAAMERDVRIREDAIKPLRQFTVAWEPHIRPAGGKDLGNHLRNALTTIATRTGLTSEGATVPRDPRNYAVGGNVIRVQQVSLTVVSESLPAVLAWLGAVEKEFPYARVEAMTISGYASRSVQLAVTLLHPLDEASLTREGPGAANSTYIR